MSILLPDSTIELSIATSFDAALPASRSKNEIEAEVIALFDQFRSRLLRYVLSMGVYPPDAEDIIQEVFLSLFKHLRMGKSRANLRGWVFRVAHNLALKRRNSRGRHTAKTKCDNQIADDRLDPAAGPEEQYAYNERRKRLLAIVGALPEQDRWCIYLRAEGLRYREIAETLGMSLGSVSNSLARSIARLVRADERG
jgi:RNA polymerase sigma-70 factor, ECF subfamily